jgi:hypothetical protein
VVLWAGFLLGIIFTDSMGPAFEKTLYKPVYLMKTIKNKTEKKDMLRIKRDNYPLQVYWNTLNKKIALVHTNE